MKIVIDPEKKKKKKSNNVEVIPCLYGRAIIWFKTAECIYDFCGRQMLTLMWYRFEMGLRSLVVRLSL